MIEKPKKTIQEIEEDKLIANIKIGLVILLFIFGCYGLVYSQNLLGEYYMRKLQRQEGKDEKLPIPIIPPDHSQDEGKLFN